MNQTPTFKLHEDAIVDQLKQELAAHGPDVVVSALAEFFRGHVSLRKRVAAVTGAAARSRKARERRRKEREQKAVVDVMAALSGIEEGVAAS